MFQKEHLCWNEMFALLRGSRSDGPMVDARQMRNNLISKFGRSASKMVNEAAAAVLI